MDAGNWISSPLTAELSTQPQLQFLKILPVIAEENTVIISIWSEVKVLVKDYDNIMWQERHRNQMPRAFRQNVFVPGDYLPWVLRFENSKN